MSIYTCSTFSLEVKQWLLSEVFSIGQCQSHVSQNSEHRSFQ